MADEGNNLSRRVLKLSFTFIVILGVALYVFDTWSANREKSMRVVTIERMSAVEDALARYLVDSAGALPTTEQGLAALLAKPENSDEPVSWQGPYIDDPTVLKDGWGREFDYICPGRPIRGYTGLYEPYSLWSYGADGSEGGDEENADVLSWDRTTMIP